VTAMVRAAFAAILLLAGARAAAAEDGVAADVIGRWATPGVSAIVELSACAERSTLCGTIRWLWDAVDEKGQPRLDSQNADASLRSRPLIGLAILSGLKARQGGGWEGRIYNPEDGQTYRATVSRRGADALQVEGHVLIVCQKQAWRKASVLAGALR
jgi:uncharacterized protein (DUF2147 family)